MEKIKLPKKFIVTADWHLRSTVPSCLDMSETEWIYVQQSALNAIENIAIENKLDVFVVGDLFHSYKTTSFGIIQMVQNLAVHLYSYGLSLYVLFGNHDLKFHSSENVDISAVGILLKSVNIYPISRFDNVSAPNFDEDDVECEYMFKHTLCLPKKDFAFSNVEYVYPEKLLSDFKKCNFFFTGDYHRNFVHRSLDDRYVINSGCLTKQASDFEDYETGVYIVDLESCEIKWCPVNIEQKFVKNGSISKVDKSIEDFVSGIKKESVTLDFIGTLRNELDGQKKDVKEKVEEWIENIGQ